MKIGITQRLFLAITLAAGLAALSMVLVMQWSVRQGFLRYINATEKAGISRLADSLEEAYRPAPGWDFVVRDPLLWQRLVFAAMPGGGPPPPGTHPGPPPAPPLDLQPGPPPGPAPNPGPDGGPPPRPLPPHLTHHFEQRMFLLDANKKVLIGHVALPQNSETTPLSHDGKVVGYVGLLPRKELSEPHQERFLKEQAMAFAMVTGVILLLATVLSLFFSRRLVQPLRELADATHQLAAGRFATRVEMVSDDELGQLADHFNTLATTLEKNEQARRQWVADISHELRTPVAILRGEIEALQDGIRQPDPGSLRSLHGEVLRLGRLVDDLHQLAMSDLGALTYRKEILDLAEVLTETVAAYGAPFSGKGITVTTDILPEDAVALSGDAERLRQLFTNLLDNSLKYTNAGGALRIAMTRQQRTVIIDFQDSAPGVAGADRERLFERLYRVESSRNRATGGGGLGLSICRNIVEAHQGTIAAHPSPLGGLWIQVELPLTEGG